MIKCFMTNLGVLIGQIPDDYDGGNVTIKNPASIVSKGNDTGLADILSFFEEDTIVVNQKDIIAGPFTPKMNSGIEEYYKHQFMGNRVILPENVGGLILS